MILMERPISFQPIALQQIAKIIAGDLSGSEIRDFFNRAGFSHIILTNETKWKSVYSALEQIKSGNDSQKLIELIELFCDAQEFFGKSEKREPIIIKINEVLNFYKLKYDMKSSAVISSNRIKQLSRDQDKSLERLKALSIGGSILHILKTSEKELNQELLKKYFPKAPKKSFDGGLFLLQKYLLLKTNNDGLCVLTQKANDILSDDIDLNTKVLKLLQVSPFDLNEISVLLQTNFYTITAVFIALSKENLVTCTSYSPYPRTPLGVGTPVAQLTTNGTKFLKKDNDESPKFTIGTAGNVYVGNNINVTNIQSTIDQLIIQIDAAKDIDDKTKKELKTKLEKFKYAGNEAFEFAKSIGSQLMTEMLRKFFFT